MTDLQRALGGDPELVFVTLLAISGMATAIVIVTVSVITVQWRKLRQAEDENALKQEMIDRGMTADEIVQIIRASGGSSWRTRLHELGFKERKACWFPSRKRQRTSS